MKKLQAPKGRDLSSPCMAKKSMKPLADRATRWSSREIEENTTLISLNSNWNLQGGVGQRGNPGYGIPRVAVHH